MYVEAAIDFPEEEIDFLSDGKIEKDLEEIISQLLAVKEKARQGSLIKDGMQLVIAGSPNAGKSSLLNALSGQDTAIVTAIPGTTRDILKEKIQIDGMPLHLIDTAGLRISEDTVEQEGIRRAHQQIKQADHVLWVYDAVSDPQHNEFLNANLPTEIPVTFIRNKIDQLKENPGLNLQANEIALSAKKHLGMELLREHLKKVMGFRGQEEGEFLARRRHVDALTRAEKHLGDASRALHELRAGELLAEELRLAQNCLGEITGEFTNEDLLGKIFSSFCIGK
jgi:tRNA modification GTPase